MKSQWFSKILSAILIVLLALASLPVKSAYAAAAVLNVWTNIASTGASGNNGNINAGNLTVSAGTDRLFVAAVCMELNGANDFNSLDMALGGTTLTQIGSTEGSNAQEHCYMGYLLNSQIPVGSNTLTIPYDITGTTTVTGAHVYWASFSGINQTTPLSDSNANASGAANVTFGAQIDYLQDGITLYAAANGGTIANMTTIPAGFSQLLTTTSNGHTSFIASITTAPHASNGNFAGGSNVAFTGTTQTRSAIVVASLRPAIYSTTVGVATAIAASSTTINVSMPYTNDQNANNTYTVQYCLTSSNCAVSGLWINWVTGAAHTASPYTTTITGLTASTSYDVRVTYNDADGVNGTNPQTITVTTLAPPSEMDIQGNGISISDGDNSPSAADNTDFGNVPQGLFVDKTFTIYNTGTGDLTLGAITFTSGDTGDFSVVTSPTSPVVPGGSTTLVIRLTAGAGGGTTRDTTVNIVNNDSNENPYNFAIQGTRVNPEINVQGGFPLTNITDGAGLFQLSAANCSFFPTASYPGGHSDCTYTITNESATVALSIGTVTVTGGNAASFSVITQPASSVAPSGTTTFTVRFTPSGVGSIFTPETTTVTFPNNDANENPYNWLIAGYGTANTPPTTSGIANVNVLEDAANTDVDLFPSFADAEDMDSELTYTVQNNTNPGLFTSVTAPPLGGQFLVLDYAPDVSGSANITVRATDAGNLFVETTFTVTVTSVNDAPSFIKGADQTVNEDAGAQSVPGWATSISSGPANESAQTVSFSATNNNNALFSVQPAIAPNGTLSYTPAPDANGVATITVTISDNGGTANGGVDTSAPQTFTITVSSVNDAPSFAAGADQTVDEDAGPQTVAGWATAISAGPANESAQMLTFNIIGNTNAGLFSAGPAVDATTGDLTYTPAANANGVATITLTLSDDGGGTDTSAPQSFTITVNSVNDAPAFIKGADQSVDEDAGAQSVPGWATGITPGPADEASQILTFNASNDNNALFSVQPAVAPNGELTYTPASDANGVANVTLTLSDDGGTANGGSDTSAPQTFTITVGAVNDAPSFTVGADQTVNEDAGAQTVPGWATSISAGPADEAGQVLTFNIDNNTNPGLFSAGPAVDATTGDLTYTLAPNANGVATITLSLSDDGGTANGGLDTSAGQTFTITVGAVNDAPSFAAGTDQTVNEDAGAQTVSGWATAISAGPADESGQALIFNITGNTNPGLFSAGPAVDATTGDLTYTPAPNANGSATITLTLSDDGGTANGGVDTSAPQTFTITVNSVNDAPSFTAGADQTVAEDAGPQTVAGWATGLSAGPANESGQVLTFNIDNNTNPGLFSTGPAVDATTGDLTYTPAPNANGVATITLSLSDNGGTANGGVDTSAGQTFTITVGLVNDPPLFTAGADQTVDEDAGAQTVAGWATAISAGPADEAGQTLTFNITGNTNPGLFSVSPSVDEITGDLTYTPAPNANGAATITLTLSDNGGTLNGGVDTSAPQSFTITVNSVNDVPSFVKGANQTVNEDAGPQSVAGWATAISAGPANEAGQVLTFNLIGNTNPGLFSAGPAVDATTGDLTYTPAANANGAATITLTLSDDGGTANGGVDTSASQTFTITVNAVNDAPTFISGADQTVNEDAGAQIVPGWATAISAGPADETGQILTFNITGNTNPGLFSAGPTVNVATGNLTYTPVANANGVATITLTLSDNGGGTDTSVPHVFTITVSPINDVPSFVKGADQSILEDAGAQTVNGWATTISAGPANEAAQILTFNITGNTNPGLFSAGPAVDPTTGDLTYTTAPNANGFTTITLTISDDGGGTDTSAPQSFVINVTAVNDAPTFTVGPDQTVNEDSGPHTIAGWATGISAGPADEAAQTLTFNITGNTNPALFSAGPSVNPLTGNLTYTSAPGANGSATITLTLSDNGGTINGGVNTSAPQTFDINVISINNAPSFIKGTDQTVNEDAGPQTVAGWATAISAGSPLEVGQVLTFNITGNTNPGLFSAGPAVAANGTLTYTPVANISGSATITLTLSDDGGTANGGVDTSAPQSFIITVNPVNDAPDFTASNPPPVTLNAPTQTINNWATFNPGPADEAGQTLLQYIVSNSTCGTLLSAGPAVDNAGILTYTPAVNQAGSCTFDVQAQDDGGTANGGVDTSLAQTFTIEVDASTQTINVITPAPASATNGSTFDVEATATSGLPVTITTSGVCTGGDTDGTATITMTSGTGVCSVFYDQAGDSNYLPAPQVQEDVNATDAPVFTSVNNASFDLGFAGSFNITATGNPSTMTITVTGALPAGVTFTDNGDGTASFGGTPTAAGVFNLILTADNGVAPNGVQTFTLTVRNGPAPNLVNSSPDTGDGSISENENISSTLNITQLIVEFNRDVYNPSGDTDTDDVTNPANFVLVRSATGVFHTASCAGGVVSPDVSITVNSVAYNNGGGSGPFVATLSINDGLPLNVDGFYRLYVCGTTSIVDATNIGLVLAGNGVNPGTDFVRNFRIETASTGGGGGGGGGGHASAATTVTTSGAFIPVTGFTPNVVTRLPVQEKAYTASNLVLEIPLLGLKMPIVGIPFKDDAWDVRWLENNAGYLDGSAYPTWNGNSVLTGHVTDANGKPGPFAYIHELRAGNKIYIHNNGFIYVYEVRQTQVLKPNNIQTLFRHEDDAWVTLVTCENFNAKTEEFTGRRMVSAVLISIVPEK